MAVVFLSLAAVEEHVKLRTKKTPVVGKQISSCCVFMRQFRLPKF